MISSGNHMKMGVEYFSVDTDMISQLLTFRSHQWVQQTFRKESLLKTVRSYFSEQYFSANKSTQNTVLCYNVIL